MQFLILKVAKKTRLATFFYTTCVATKKKVGVLVVGASNKSSPTTTKLKPNDGRMIRARLVHSIIIECCSNTNRSVTLTTKTRPLSHLLRLRLPRPLTFRRRMVAVVCRRVLQKYVKNLCTLV